MKNLMIILVLSVFIGSNAYAQEAVEKDVFLTTINSVNDLKISNLKTTQLMDYNKGFADSVYVILDGEKSEKDQQKALEALNTSTKSDLDDLLGESLNKKYAKLMQEQLKPLIKKNKLFKYLYQ